MPLLSSTQLHSNFELNSKLPNFTRDSFKTYDEMVQVDPLYMDEGHISYCEEKGEHYIYHTDKGGQASWTALSTVQVTAVDNPEDANQALVDSLEPGSLAFVKSTDRLYYRGFTKAIENHDPEGKVSAWLHPIIPITELENTYLKKTDAEDTYLTKTTAGETYLTKTEAADTYLTQQDASNIYLSKTDADDEYLKPTVADDKYLSKTDAEEQYALKEEISGLIDKYIPGLEHTNTEVWVDIAEGLKGKTGSDIKELNLAFNQIFDEILFKEVRQNATEPHVEINFNIEGWRPEAEWYDENIALVEAGRAPDAGHFSAKNVINSYIVETKKSFTNGIRVNQIGQFNSKTICKILKDNNWVNYESDDTTIHIPTDLEPGVYRYYYLAYFNKSNPIKNNKGENIREWDVSKPIESSNYITLNVSKPIKYNTINGLVENKLVYWDDHMVDYFELPATCQTSQKFILPRKAKHIYIWNDICGYAEDLSFKETITNSDYIYEYPHSEDGHRGAVKIKVEF